ncbi:hypothetical protein GCM10028857_10220 [Salinarchaeum chitinilyticum]
MAERSEAGSNSPVDAAEPARPVEGREEGSAPGAVDRLADALDDLRDENGEIRLSRREALAYGAGTGAGLGGWKGLHNVVLGYGIVAGTNVLEQDLDALASEHFGVRSGVTAVGDFVVRADGDSAGLYDGEERIDGVGIDDEPTAAEQIDQEYELAGEPFAQLHADMGALAAGDATFEFSKTAGFLDRIEGADARPFTVDALRGPVFDSPEAPFVADFADVHPADAGGLIGGLKHGFRTYSSYDIPRYLAGSIQDNVILGAHDLRQYFESPTDFEALANGENSGLFCTELVNRSIEAFHAVPAVEQSPPVVAGSVYDQRHKHSYTVLASAIREDGKLVLPATFVDYTHSTLYDDLHLRWLMGEGVEAYNDRHRVTEIFWNRYTSI